MADIKYLDKTGLTTVKSILDGLFATKGHSHSKGEIGLGNVDNTADKDKNVKYASSAGYADDSNLLDGKDSAYFDTAPFSTIRDFTLGTLIKTDINYNVTSGDPFYVEIKGNTYVSPGSMYIQIQGYIYNDTIINYSVTSLGVVYPSEIIAKNVGGYLCFWFPRIAYWHGYYIKVTTGYNYSVNRVTDVLDSNEPSGTKRVVLTNTFYTNYSNNNLTISGGGASGGSSLSIKTNSTTYSLTIPTSLPASDVYSWAKASTKPSYTKSEVGLGNVDNTADANKSVNYATSAGSASSAGSATTTRYITSPDTRSTPYNINEMVASSSGVCFDFKQKSISGLSAAYSGIMTYRPYSTASDWTGGPAHQLAFDENGLHWRIYNGSGFSNWSTVSFNGHGTHVSSGAQTWAGVKTFSSAPVFSAGFSSSSNVTITGSVTASAGFFDNSDERLKDFYDDIDVDFNKLKSIPKKYFSWKSDENKEIHLGTSAQAVQAVYPEIINDNDGTLTVDYSKLSVVALAAVDKLYDENQELKSKISVMEERLAKLEKLLGV